MKPGQAPLQLGLFVALAVVLPSLATANQISNGGFESPVLAPGGYQVISPGGEPAGFQWVVTSGTVDVGHLPVSPFIEYPAYELNQAIDLNGDSAGAIYQDFGTVPGQWYELTFAYADNPLGGGTSTADVDVIDVVSTSSLLDDNIAHSTSTNSPPFADWTLYSNYFQATGNLTRLSFTSTSPDVGASGGIVLDAVSVVETVPEPSTWILMGLGAIAILTMRRRRAA